MTFEEYLTELPLDDLKLISSTLKMEPALISRARLLRELPIQVLQPGFVESCVDGMDHEVKDLLMAMIIAGDKGYTCDVKNPANQAMAPPLYNLLSHGLIVGRSGKYHAPDYVIPTDIRNILIRHLNHQLHDRLESQEPPPAIDEAASLSFIRDLFSFMSWLRIEPARMTDKEVIYKRAQDELLERLESSDTYKESSLTPYPDRLQLMIRYCESRRLIYVEDTTLRCTSSFEQWLHLPTEEKLDDLLAFWYTRNQNLSQRTTGLLGTLHLCLDLKGVDVNGLIDLVLSGTPGLSREASSLQHHRQSVLDALRELEWLGFLHQYGDRGGNSAAFIITPLGRSVLGNRTWSEEGLWTDRFVVQPTFEMMVACTTHLTIRDELERFADLVAVDLMLTYRITKDTIYRAGDDGMSGEAIIAFLERHSEKQIPQNVEYSIREWGDNYGQVYFMDVFLLRTASVEIAQHIKAHKQLAPYIQGEVAPDALIVERHNYREMMDILRGLEFMPKSQIIGMNMDHSTTHKPFAREWFADVWARHGTHRSSQKIIGIDECLPGFRLSRRIHSPEDDTTHLSQSSTMQYLSPRHTQELLELAITKEQIVLIDYHIGNRSRSYLQKIRPQSIDNSRGAPYVEAYRLLENDVRSFKISNIKSIRVTDDTD